MRSHGSKRLPNWAIGLIGIVVIAIASVLAYTKTLPWADPYEVEAVFSSAQNVAVKSPVRIAGVKVGEVTGVEPLGTSGEELIAQSGEEPASLPGPDDQGSEAASVVTMKLDPEALPLHEDARFKLRPRLFLEGNLFVDVQPGSPNAPETDEGHEFPITQTANSVQLDQVLTTLQSDVRADLQTFLDQFGNALIKYKGAEAFNELYRSSAGAGKYTSQVNNAFLGKRPHDLSGLIRNLDRVLRALGENETALQGLVTNFRTFSGSFAAEDAALERAIANLPDVLDASRPAFANLNASFPPLRAFAREALPGVRSTPAAITAATPFIHQVRRLVSERELRGLVRGLRPTIPRLAKLAKRTIPFLRQSRALASCFNEVVIPWSHDTVDPPDSYPYQPVGEVGEETLFGFSGISSESRSGDANGQYIRVEAGGGTNTVVTPTPPGEAGDFVGLLPAGPLQGVTPRLPDSEKTVLQREEACETQDQPDLSSGVGSIPFPQDTVSAPSPMAGLDQDLIEGLAARVDEDDLSEAVEDSEQANTQVEAIEAGRAVWEELIAVAEKSAKGSKRGKGLGKGNGGQKRQFGPNADAELGGRLMTEIRKQLPNFLAITVLFVIAIATTYYIIQEQRLRIPILEDRPFEMKAEFETAQAVVPGQGQTIRVAGVRVGDVTTVEVEDGKGLVTFNIDREYLPIYQDATILMRPTTGLKDMFFDMDPGTKAAGEFEEGETIAVSNTAPDVNLDEILSVLDGDTQAYLRLLLVGAGQGLEGRDKELGELLGGLGPINKDLKQLNSEVAKRQTNLRNLVHNFNILTGRIAQNDDDLTQLVAESNTALGSIAEQDPNVQRAVSLLPGTLQQAEETLNELADFGAVLGPTFNDLRPFARNLGPANASLKRLADSSTSVLRDEVRPFVRAARPPLPDLRRAAKRYSEASPRLVRVGKKLNTLGDMAAYNPNGAQDCPGGVCPAGRQEGYLYWLAWLGHNSNTIFSTADGNGPLRRIYFTAGCDELANIITTGPDSPLIDNPTLGNFQDFLRQQINGTVTGLGPLFSAGGLCAA